MSIADRIKEYRDFKKIGIKEFEKLCGLSNGYLNKITSPGAVKLENILSKCSDLSREWVLKGTVPMLKMEPRQRASIEFGNVGRDFNSANENSSINTGAQYDSEGLKNELGKCKEELSRLKDIIMEKDKELIELYKKK